MELKEYIQIIKRNRGVFLGIIIITILAVFGWLLLRPKTVNVSLDFDITRTGKDATVEYQYDDFYRLQADEKFSETLVQWIKSPEMVASMLKRAGLSNEEVNLKKLSKFFTAEKVSSQVVAVSFSAKDEKEAQRLSLAMSEALNENIKNLNEEQGQDNWFKIVKRGPIVRPNVVDLRVAILSSILVGIFIGFWVVMIKHYLE